MIEHDSYEDSEGSENLEPSRPNRYDGPVSTWQSLTEPERGLAASLDQLRNEDLSVHLYNAHALKLRARKYYDSKKRKHSDISAIHEDDDTDAQQSFIPPKAWTAWPLPPNIVPREAEHIGPEDKDAIYTLCRQEVQWPSGSLEEELVAVSLKIAKEKFEARDWKDDDDDTDHQEVFKERASSDFLGENVAHSAQNEEHLFIEIGKQSSEAPTDKILMRPIISADDERSRELLRPSIRHTLLKLDQVLMALHHARQTCHEIHEGPSSVKDTPKRNTSRAISAHSGDSDNEDSDYEETKRIEKRRPVGRPRKFENIPPNAQSKSRPDLDTEVVLRPKPSTMGRPRKQYERYENETEQEYLIRVARMQKKPLPHFAPRCEEKDTRRTEEPKEKTPRQNLDPEYAKVRWEKNLKPRDWSEILGSAALVGFSPEVIARATQRCANLFGEGMTMRHIVEAPVSAGNQETLKQYVPGSFSEPEAKKPATVDISSGSDYDSQESGSSSQDYKPAFTKPHGPMPKKVSCFCPIAECVRSVHGFSTQNNLTRHLSDGHGKTIAEIDALIYGGGDEMDGAVHVDGFMKPLQFKKAGRGKDKNERKKGRWLKREEGTVESGTQSDSLDDSSDTGSEQSD